MRDLDDDQLISSAFQQFDRAADPAVRPAGSAAVRSLAVQRRRTRTATLSALAALVIAAPVATYAALGQDNQGPPTPPGSTASVPAPAFATAYFVSWAHNEQVQVYSLSSGGHLTRLASLGIDNTEHIRRTLSVAPNGMKLAWIEPDNNLYVANLDGTQKRKVTGAQDSAGDLSPAWTPDSSRLLTSDGTYVVATGGASIAPGAPGPYLRYSANGMFYAHLAATGPARISVKRASGILVSEYPFACNGCDSAKRSVLAVSDDGRYVATGDYPTDGAREQSWRSVVDASAGRELSLTFEPANSGRFLADGSILLATPTELKLMGIDGQISQTIRLPAELKPGASVRVELLLVN